MTNFVEIYDRLTNTYTTESLEWGRWLFAQSCDFVRGVATLNDLIDFDLNEVAFAGRSNVGKSSLINALTGRNSLAKTSNTPGRTQQLNFFILGQRLYVVDMPGYGYAKVSKATKAVWQTLIRTYLRGRPTLERVYVLVDSRVGLKENDQEIMKMLDTTAVSYQVVLTKIDKVGKTQLKELIASLEEMLGKHPAAHPRVIATSADKGDGIAELRAEIAQFAQKTT